MLMTIITTRMSMATSMHIPTLMVSINTRIHTANMIMLTTMAMTTFTIISPCPKPGGEVCFR
jgi:hypothetical protein